MTETGEIPTDTPAWVQNGTHTSQVPIDRVLVKSIQGQPSKGMKRLSMHVRDSESALGPVVTLKNKKVRYRTTGKA